MTDRLSERDPASTKGIALVTGASAGIGATYAQRLAARGFDLLLVARRAELLDELAASLRTAHGVHVTTLPADLAKPADVEKVAQQLEHNERITLLLNNAGVGTMKPVAEMPIDAFNAMTDVNISALVRLSKAAVTAFKKRDRGTIINIGSVLSLHTLPVSAAYSGTKGYVLNFTRGLQTEVEGTNVFVQFVAPTATATDIWELAGVPLSSFDPTTLMSVDDLVDAALSGLDQGEQITFPSVEDEQLLAEYENARQRLFAASQTGKVASRYHQV